ncbi:hypothetical protein ACOSQ2_033389 [Xanthoceras sorbifolium]
MESKAVDIDDEVNHRLKVDRDCEEEGGQQSQSGKRRNPKPAPPPKAKCKRRFMQRHYHKGAFFDEIEILAESLCLPLSYKS